VPIDTKTRRGDSTPVHGVDVREEMRGVGASVTRVGCRFGGGRNAGMQARRWVLGAVGAMAVAILANGACAGPRVTIDDETWMEFGFLGQVHATWTEDATDETDFFLRRARIILSGQVMDGVKFFAETDNDNAGKNGVGSVSTDIQDAFLDVRLPVATNHWIKAGLILLPFSFESRAGATTLLGNDYNVEAIKLVNTFVWRDYGAEVHGHFLDQRLAYFAGVFDGYDTTGSTKNDDADLRVTGHLAVNVIGKAETGWFFSQNRLGKAGNYVSIGAGYDAQNDASLILPVVPEGEPPSTEPGRVVDSENYVVDLQSGYDLGPCGLTLNAAWYEWDNSAFEGSTAFVETGVLVGRTMVTGKFVTQDPDIAATVEDFVVGLHFFGKGHNVRGGVEYRWGDSPDQVLVGVQFLL